MATRPVFEWSDHSRYLAHLRSSRAASIVADLLLLALLILPFAAMLTAGVLRLRAVDGMGWITLALAIVVLAAWMRLAAWSLSVATVAVAATVAWVAAAGTHGDGISILLAACVPTILRVLVPVPVARLARRRVRHRRSIAGPWWATRSARTNVWLHLPVDAIRVRWPWMFVPTLALAAIAPSTIDRSAAAASDPLLFVTGLLLAWQLAAAAKTTSLAMDGWRRSPILHQLPSRPGQRVLRVMVSSVLLFALVLPAEALSLHASGNSATDAWTSLAVAAPWLALWAPSRLTLAGILAWSAVVGVTWVSVLLP